MGNDIKLPGNAFFWNGRRLLINKKQINLYCKQSLPGYTMNRSLQLIASFFLSTMIFSETGLAQSTQIPKDPLKKDLIPPILLKKQERYAGNPLATYAEMIYMEKSYKSSPLAPIYDEMRFNMEEFLGIADAGKQAMQLSQYKVKWQNQPDSIDGSWDNLPAIPEIIREAKKTSIVIWGEEHHLPQSRSLYESMIRELWKLGYRYLAAETFADNLSDSMKGYIDYNSGYYLADPVFASAVNTAIRMGYKLIDYDTYETSPTEPSFRDMMQAKNIYDKTFKKDKEARVLILAGRGHASEEIASNGWKPMGYNLKNLTGIDPFTLFAVTMTERIVPEDEHPLYRYATSKGLVKDVTLFKNRHSGKFLNAGSFDAYVFFPRVKLIEGRPDWLFNTLGRKKVNNPFKDKISDDLQLVQAFFKDQPVNSIPVDQFVVNKNEPNKSFALKPGNYLARIIDKSGNIISQMPLTVGRK